MKAICVIGVRAGSKSVPDKNIRNFAGKPLLAHTIEQALESGCFDEICVSSDSQEYLDIGTRYGATQVVVRPAELATDAAGKLPVVLHAVEKVETCLSQAFDIVVDLQVTTPLRLPEDIQNALSIYKSKSNLVNVFSVQPAHSSPYFTLIERDATGGLELCKTMGGGVARRQDAPESYDINGAVYVWNREALRVATGVVSTRSEIYVMPQFRSLDIDTEFDFLLAEFAYENIDRRTGKHLFGS